MTISGELFIVTIRVGGCTWREWVEARNSANILQFMGKAPQQRVIRPPMSEMLRFFFFRGYRETSLIHK